MEPGYFWGKNLKVYGSKVWNSLPFHIKTSENLVQFKSLMKNWNGNSCSCIVCTSDSLVLFFYYRFYKTLDISFHTKILHSPVGRISFVNYRLRHVTEYITIRL